MKKLLLLFLISFSSYSQVSVGEKEAEDIIVGSVKLYPKGSAELKIIDEIDGKNLYYLGYQNQDYSQIISIESVVFTATKEDIDGLFDILKMVLKNGEKKTVNLGENFVVKASKIGKDDIFFWIMEGSRKNGNFSISTQGLYSLFGKQFNKKEWKAFLKS